MMPSNATRKFLLSCLFIVGFKLRGLSLKQTNKQKTTAIKQVNKTFVTALGYALCHHNNWIVDLDSVKQKNWEHAAATYENLQKYVQNDFGQIYLVILDMLCETCAYSTYQCQSAVHLIHIAVDCMYLQILVCKYQCIRMHTVKILC